MKEETVDTVANGLLDLAWWYFIYLPLGGFLFAACALFLFYMIKKRD